LDQLKHLRTRRKIGAVLGLVVYVGLVALFVVSVTHEGPHLGFGRRLQSTWGDWGILGTLLLAGPVVLYAVYVELGRK
jgi:hypothetical protein